MRKVSWIEVTAYMGFAMMIFVWYLILISQ